MFRGLTPAQESLFLTLYFRALDYGSPRPILGDRTWAELVHTVDYDFRRLKAIRAKSLDLALRTKGTLRNKFAEFRLRFGRESEVAVCSSIAGRLRGVRY